MKGKQQSEAKEPHQTLRANAALARRGKSLFRPEGAYRRGLFTAEAIEDRCALRSLIRESRELIAMLPGEGEQ